MHAFEYEICCAAPGRARCVQYGGEDGTLYKWETLLQRRERWLHPTKGWRDRRMEEDWVAKVPAWVDGDRIIRILGNDGRVTTLAGLHAYKPGEQPRVGSTGRPAIFTYVRDGIKAYLANRAPPGHVF